MKNLLDSRDDDHDIDKIGTETDLYVAYHSDS